MAHGRETASTPDSSRLQRREARECCVENAGGCDISTDTCQVAAGVNLRPPSGEPARRPPGMRTVSDSGAVRG